MRDMVKKRAADKALRERKKEVHAHFSFEWVGLLLDGVNPETTIAVELTDPTEELHSPESEGIGRHLREAEEAYEEYLRANGYEPEPPVCHKCHEYFEEGAATKEITVDLDPGDPEVGPAPDICEVLVHEDCLKGKALVPALAFEEVIRNAGCWWVREAGRSVLTLIAD